MHEILIVENVLFNEQRTVKIYLNMSRVYTAYTHCLRECLEVENVLKYKNV